MEIRFQQAGSGNYQPAARTARDIRYLVIHHTAGDGESAGTCACRSAEIALPASLHYFVDGNEVWQSVPDKDIAWHCGTRGTYYHPYCRNENSIGIGLCGRILDGRYSLLPETAARAAALARELTARYGIPAENVLRHYDVTHKTCPVPFVESTAAWRTFRERLWEEAAR